MLFPFDVSHLRLTMLIFLRGQTAVDVNILLPSMLIFSLLVTGPFLTFSFKTLTVNLLSIFHKFWFVFQLFFPLTVVMFRFGFFVMLCFVFLSLICCYVLFVFVSLECCYVLFRWHFLKLHKADVNSFRGIRGHWLIDKNHKVKETKIDKNHNKRKKERKK